MIVDPRMTPEIHARSLHSASRRGMVRRHVGVIGEGHRLCTTATAGPCCTSTCKHREQTDREDFHHGYVYLSFDTSPQAIKTVTNIADPIYARKLRGAVATWCDDVSRFR